MTLPAFRLNVQRLLIGLIGVLLAVLVLEWVLPDGSATDAAVPRPHLAVHTARQAVMARDTSQWVETVLARPLFSISRRPPKAAARPGSVAAAAQARLAGIMITRYGRRAIFAPEGGGKQLVLGEGAAVNASTIRQIQADNVVLASGAVLRLAFDKTRVPGQAATFAPIQAGFPNPAFPNMNFPNAGPGFPGQGFPGPGFAGQGAPGQGFAGGGFPNQAFPSPGTPPGIPPQAAGGDDVPPTMPPQGFRNPMIPQRRE